jgi:hypothetical protein
MQIFARRTLLAAAAAALLVSFRRGRAEVPLCDRLARLFRHPESARVVGAAYLRLVREEADVEQLAALLEAELGEAEGAALERRLAAQQRADFGAGRTVVVEGWILSRTEARVCALLAAA